MNSAQALIKTLLQNPSSIASKSQAIQLHAQIIKSANHPSTFSSHISTLLSIYSNFSLLHESLLIFNTLHSPSTRAWKSIIKTYTANGCFLQSLASFLEMRASGIHPDHNMFPSVLKSCTHLKDLRLCESVHGCIIRLGMSSDLYTGNALMNMYSKLQMLDKPQVFGKSTERKQVLGNGSNFVCFEQKTENGLLGFGDLKHTSRKITSLAVSQMDGVRKVFEEMPIRDVVSWNTVIAGYAQNRMYEEGLMIVRELGNANLKPDVFTLSSVLPIFSEYVNVMKGKEIHGYTIRHGFDEDVYIGSSLINMYANCSRMEDSFQVFYLLPSRDHVSWNSIIAGCVQNGLFDEGLKLFRQMLIVGIKPVHVSFSSLMPACAHLTTLHLGKQLHGCIIKGGFDDNIFIASSLVDMYAKCGNIRIAKWIFDKMEKHDMVSWTAMIMGYALHGSPHDAISSFEQMEIDGVRPNYMAFIAVLTACSHGGMIDEAWKHFNSMSQNYSISPGLEHYAAMADLLGRAGKLEEAYEFVSGMKIKQTGSIWSILLAACRVHKNVELAEKVAKKIVAIDPENMGAYVLLSNTYSGAGRFKDAEKLRLCLTKKGMRKNPAVSWIEVRNKVHAFIAGDKSHPCFDRINEALDVLFEQMEGEGYVPLVQ